MKPGDFLYVGPRGARMYTNVLNNPNSFKAVTLKHGDLVIAISRCPDTDYYMVFSSRFNMLGNVYTLELCEV